MVECPIECVRGACPDGPDFLEKNGAFLLTVIASASACLALTFTYFLKSRCKNIQTPCVSCQRDVVELDAKDVEVVTGN